MRIKRRREILVETAEILQITGREKVSLTFCAKCSERIGMITMQEAMALAGVTSLAIYRRVEAGQIHFTETPDGTLLLCPKALLEAEK